MPDTLDSLPSETKEIFQRFLRRPLATRGMLTRMTQEYLKVVGRVLTEKESHPWNTARRVGDGLLSLLRDCSAEELPYVQAATLYFASSEDAQPDVESEDGFDDDAEVFNAVCQMLERSDLIVPLSSRNPWSTRYKGEGAN